MTSTITRILRVLGLVMAYAASAAHAQCPVQRLFPSPYYPESGYGTSVALEGDTCAVFRSRFDWGPGGLDPATFIYRHVAGHWQLQQTLPGFLQPGQAHTGPVALSREWLAVGVQDFALSPDHVIGGVQTYVRTERGWTQRQMLFDSSLQFPQWMGWDVSLTKRHLAVGSNGHAYVYELQPSTSLWKLMAKLPDHAGFIPLFGVCVALDDTTLVVGSPAPSPGDVGAAYLYELQEGVWRQVQRLQPEPVASNQTFGQSLSIAGSHCLVATFNYGLGEGIVYAFERRGTTWEFLQKLQPIDKVPGQFFGQSVDVSGQDAVISASGPGESSEARVAYHFQFREGTWLQVGKLVPEHTASVQPSWDDSVAVSGTTALLGASHDALINLPEMRPQGLAFVFELAPEAMQYCTCLKDLAPCGAYDKDAGCRNSTSRGAMLTACGSASTASDDLRMQSRWMPMDVPAIVMMGPRPDSVPYGDGRLCVGPGDKGLFRFPAGSSGQDGKISLGPGIIAYSYANFPAAGHIQAGDTWYFQAWYRDANGPCGSGFNLSNGLKVDFTQ